MRDEEIIGLSIFGLLVLGALVLALRQGAKQRAQLARYAARHGWSVARTGDARLNALLESMSSEETWSASNVMQVEPAPTSMYLFHYQVAPKGRPSNSSHGHACLAVHTGRMHPTPVVIFTRTPGIEVLVPDRVQVSGEEFADEFTVMCKQPGAVLNSVNEAVKRTLLEHAADPGWNLTVTIAGRQVLVSSFWAQTEQEWDYLIALTGRLRAALR